MRKEGLQVLRDPSSIGIAFLLPLLLLFLVLLLRPQGIFGRTVVQRV